MNPIAPPQTDGDTPPHDAEALRHDDSNSYAAVTPAVATVPPIWKPERKAEMRRPTEPRHDAPSNVLALRNDGYDQLLQRRYSAAISLLQQASAMGDAYAPMYIGQIFESGLGVARDVGQASYWYGIAINRGNAAALAALNRLRMNPY